MAQEPEEKAQELMAEMSRLIASVEQQLAESKEVYAKIGFDPANASEAVSKLPPQAREELERLIREDNEAVEQAVQNAKLQMQPRSAVKVKMRPMI